MLRPHVGQRVRAGITWYRELRPDDPAGSDDVVLGELTFLVERATYANTRTPGMGVPFYL